MVVKMEITKFTIYLPCRINHPFSLLFDKKTGRGGLVFHSCTQWDIHISIIKGRLLNKEVYVYFIGHSSIYWTYSLIYTLSYNFVIYVIILFMTSSSSVFLSL